MVDPCRNVSPRMKTTNAPSLWPYGPFSEQGAGGVKSQVPPPRIRQQQIEEGCTTHQDNPFSPGTQSQPVSEKTAECNANSENCNTKEIASTILAIFGLTDKDLGEFSRYPDHQLTPENMPFILEDIQLRKMAPHLPSLAPPSRGMKTFCSDDGCGSTVKSKVNGNQHKTKPGYMQEPLKVIACNSDMPTEKSVKSFQALQTASVAAVASDVPNNPRNTATKPIKQLGPQESISNTQPFPSQEAVKNVPGSSHLPAGPAVPPKLRPLMSLAVSPTSQSVIFPVAQQALPPPCVGRPMIQLLETLKCKKVAVPPKTAKGLKNFQKDIEGATNSLSRPTATACLPASLQAESQRIGSHSASSAMSDCTVSSVCLSTCVEMKDGVQHLNTTGHSRHCHLLSEHCHQSSQQHEGGQNHNHRQHSISPSPEPFKCSGCGHGRHRSRSRSRSPGQERAGSSSSQSQRCLPDPRHRSRSPRRLQDSRSPSLRSSSKERRLGGSSRSPGSSAEAQRSTQSTGQPEKQHDQLAPQEKCHSEHLNLQDEATSQEQPSSEALQGEQLHNDSEHTALTSLAEKHVLQAMSLFQAGGAGGARPLAAGSLDLAAVPADVVSMVQLVATQVVQAVLASRKPLGMLGSGDVAPAEPGATASVSSEAERVEEEHEPLPCSVGAAADVAAPGPQTSTATRDSEANFSVSGKAEKQELVACPEEVSSDAAGPKASVGAPGPVAGTPVSSQAEEQKAEQGLQLGSVAAVQGKVVWICGHDVVQSAREQAIMSGKGDQLGLSDALTMKWLSRKGMQWNELVPVLEKEAAASDTPDVIVLQLGDNDLFKISDRDLIAVMQKDLLWCMERFPGVRILWSVLLPFPGWCVREKHRGLNKRRKVINHFVGSFLGLHGGNIIFHPNITPKFPYMFSKNGLCLSEKGVDIWLRNFCSGLMHLLQLRPPKIYKRRKQKSSGLAC